MKKALLVFLIIAIVGGVLITTGLALGASTGIYFNEHGLQLQNGRKYHAEEKNRMADHDLGSLTELRVEVASARVEVIASDHFGIEIDCRANRLIQYSCENGVLRVTQDSAFGWSLLDFNFGFRSEDTVKIYLPEDARLADARIQVASGMVHVEKLTADTLTLNCTSGSIKANQLTGDQIAVQSASGIIHLSGVTGDQISAKCNSGSMTFNDITASVSLEFRLTSGLLKAQEVDSAGTILDMQSGTANISGKLRGHNQMRLTSGILNLTIDGNELDYNRTLSKTSGIIRVNGNRHAGNLIAPEAENSLDASVNSGSIKIDFIQ